MEQQNVDLSGILAGEEVTEFTIEHNNKEYKFSVRELSWAVINSILSQCVTYTKNQQAHIDKSEYFIKYLEKALVTAPWPLNQTRMYVKKLSATFGKKLEEHLPNPEEDDEELKKE